MGPAAAMGAFAGAPDTEGAAAQYHASSSTRAAARVDESEALLPAALGMLDLVLLGYVIEQQGLHRLLPSKHPGVTITSIMPCALQQDAGR